MPTPSVSVIKPYRDAWAFQQTRTPLLADDYYSREFDAARPRGFTITGLQKYEHLAAANKVLEHAMATNMSPSDAYDLLGEIVNQHGGTLLPPSRFELIYHNAMVTAESAAEWRTSM